MKTLFVLFMSLILWVSPYISNHEVEGKDVSLYVSEKRVSRSTTFAATKLEIDFNIVNNLNYDIGQIILDVELLDNDVPVKEVKVFIDIEVKHHNQRLGTVEETYDLLFFDDFNILSVRTVEESFFDSYDVAIKSGVYYIFIIFFAWLVIDVSNKYILSEVHQTFKDYWWLVIIFLVIVPIFMSFISYLGRYKVLITIYGWVLFISSLAAIPVFYLILVLYHLIKEKQRA